MVRGKNHPLLAMCLASYLVTDPDLPSQYVWRKYKLKESLPMSSSPTPFPRPYPCTGFIWPPEFECSAPFPSRSRPFRHRYGRSQEGQLAAALRSKHLPSLAWHHPSYSLCCVFVLPLLASPVAPLRFVNACVLVKENYSSCLCSKGRRSTVLTIFRRCKKFNKHQLLSRPLWS